ncbi:hypothetical protein B0T16DRAFT_53178 [Cercophora newfieldiana]|uniref:VWFA domain-containing protein n=1 Tax=Cercophora newfieldiana TaxID=92897 RepID=A0AA39YR66_9PEZI|nr:hypothetical protein B0T16DRAFT_53178 [Cercophora newfieldiana]
MRLVLALLGAVAAAAASATPASGFALMKRDELETCSGLSVASNNGDRKVVIVIDSSGSMSGSDPSDLRLSAGRALNDFLISNAEASGGVKADQVSVVDFSSTALTVFGPGDPGDPKANQAITDISIKGGTFIAGGVLEAIEQIKKMSGETKDRSAIVVYTDGEDSSTTRLVDAIRNATALGIRVSFGFLDQRASQQPKEVLKAVRDSKGVYATITVAEGSINYVNYVLLNGLATQDNPQGAGDRLLAGLASTQFISGSNSVSMKYFAEQGEKANFTLVSFTSDMLDMEARMNGQSLNTTKGLRTSRKFMEVTPPGTGDMEVVITASNSPVDGLFSVLTGSSAPIKNCTVGVLNTTSLSTGAKAGIGVGAAVAAIALVAAAVAAYKHLHVGGNTTSAPVGANNTAPTMGYGDTTGYHPGGEKLGPETTHSSIPTNHTGGFEGNLTGQAPSGPMSPPLNGAAPLTGMPGAPYSGVPPFVPPLMPPPMSQNNTGKDSPSQNTGYQQPYGPNNEYQQNLGGHNGYQNNMPPSNDPYNHTSTGGDLYNHTGSPFQGNHTGSPFQNPVAGGDSYNHTGSPFQGNHTGSPFQGNSTNFDGGNHTNWTPSDATPAPGQPIGPGPGGHPHPGPPQQFFQMPSAPTWQSQTRQEQRKHHHHEWLAPDTACEHPDCPLIARDHRCAPSIETCVCTCRNGNCPVTRRGG